MRLPSITERAWLAGFLEGDGSFSASLSSKKYFYMQIIAVSTDLDSLEKIKTIIETGAIQED